MRGRVLFGLVVVEIVYLIGGGFIFWALQNSPYARSSADEPPTQEPVANISLLLQLVNNNMGQCLPSVEIIIIHLA
jgi:hypothetical protein